MRTKPPRVPGVCDKDGVALIQRDDDREETVRDRLDVYRRNTLELIPYYREQGLVREVVGQGDIEQIYSNILRSLNRRAE